MLLKKKRREKSCIYDHKASIAMYVRPPYGISRYDFPPGYEEEFEGTSRFSRSRQATSCITILLQFPEQKLRDTFHHDVTGTKLFLSPPPSCSLFVPASPQDCSSCIAGCSLHSAEREGGSGVK